MTFTQEVRIKVDGVWRGMHFYESEHSCMCLLVCVWVHGHVMCVFQSPTIPPPTIQSTPHPHHVGCQKRQVLQCNGVEIAGWGIITSAIKERFTGRPVSGVSTVPHPLALHRAGSPVKSPKRRIRGLRGTWWLKHEGERRGSSTGIWFRVGESDTGEGNKVLLDFSCLISAPVKIKHGNNYQKSASELIAEWIFCSDMFSAKYWFWGQKSTFNLHFWSQLLKWGLNMAYLTDNQHINSPGCYK